MKTSTWDPKEEQELIETLEAIALDHQRQEQARVEKLRRMQQRRATSPKEPSRAATRGVAADPVSVKAIVERLRRKDTH